VCGVIEFGRAETAAERTEVARFFYSIYVEEMGRFRDVADHARRELRDPEDAYSWLFVAQDNGRIVATCRLTWGGDGLSERQIRYYCLEPFLAEVPPELLLVGERAMVAPEYRGANLYHELGQTTTPVVAAHGVLLGFGASEPHLVPMYLRLGQRPYAPRNFWSEESGYLIPNVSIPPDNDAARAARQSPEYGAPFNWEAGAVYQSLPPGVRRYLDSFGTVRAAGILGEEGYWQEVRDALARLPDTDPGLFDDMTEAIIRRCIENSIILDCHRDDHIVKRDGTARNMYLGLSGTFEARDGDHVIRSLGPGEIFGESGLLLRQLRTADVFVTSDTARLLSLSERSLRNVVEGHSTHSRSLLLNLVKILANRLAGAGELTG
jgi:hypothetical protein